MSVSTSQSSTVEVAVDPVTAFTAFTSELDLWWVRGPINAYDAGRLVEMRCEPGVGGRILEVYDAETGEGLELARITAWEPGERVAWESSLDDVTIDVSFESTDAGTLVTLEASIPEGGEVRGGTAFVSVTPPWFGAWMERRDTATREPHDLARVALTLHYARPAAAARWLADAFGFEAPSGLPEGEDPLSDEKYGFPWIEFHVGNASLIIGQLEVLPWTTRRSHTSRGCSSTTSRHTWSAPAGTEPRSRRTSRATASPRTWRSISRDVAGGLPRRALRSRARWPRTCRTS